MDGGVTVRTKLLLSVSRTTVVTSSAEFHGMQPNCQGLSACVCASVRNVFFYFSLVSP